MSDPRYTQFSRPWIYLLAATLVALSALLIAAVPADAADRGFTQRFSTVTNGDIELTGNTSMTCPTGGASCAAARAGTAAGTLNDNNGHTMAYVDVDSDATTINSSRADLSLPSGATVLFAGLYWGGDSAAADALRGAVRIDTPAPGGYIDVTADWVAGSTALASQYGAFADVTSLVAQGGSGSYMTANVQGAIGTTRQFAGWSLVVAYRLASAPKNHIKVLDGLQRPSTDNPSVTIPISGLTTPATGPVSGTLGMVAFDGDRGTTGEAVTLNGSEVADSLNPAGSQFNSSISSRGTRVSAKDPDYVNQLGLDADLISVDGLLAPGSTSASVAMTSSNNEHYHATMVSLVNRAESTPPETTITSGPSGLTNNASPAWGFASSEAGSTFQCRMDSGAWANCSSPYTSAFLADGSHTFEVRAIDPQLNVDATPASRTIIVDATAPALVALTDSDPDSPANDNNPEIKGGAEAGSTVRLYTNATCTSAVAATGTAAAFASPGLTVAVANDTTTTYWATATDSAGNASACSTSSLQYREDSTAPALVTLSDSDPDSPANDNNPEIKGTAEAASTVRLYTNATCTSTVAASGSASAFASPGLTVTVPADATTTFWATATDAAGNASACSLSSLAYREDSTAPNTTIDSGPNGVSNDSTPTFAVSSSEAGSTFQCRVDSGAFASCTSPHTTAGLSDGAHTFEVRAIDSAGNADSTPASRTFTVDTIAPNTAIDSGPSGLTNDPTPTYAFSSNEAGSTFECRVDSGAWGGCSSPFTTGSLGDGPHSFEVRATDSAGNVDATPASRTITVDATAPQTTIDSGPSIPTGDSTPTFAFSADETPASFECRIDGGPWASCSSPHTTAELPDGTYTFEVRATDAAGNPDSTPASASITVDTTAPETTIDSGPTGLIDEATPTFAFSSSEPGSTFECRMNGGAWEGCSSPHTTADLPDGDHTFEVRATDGAGNADPTPDSRSITVDTTAPDTTIDSGPTGLTEDPTPTFGFSSSESPSAFECSVDGGAWTLCSSPETTPSLPDGPHTFGVRAIDAAGNVDPTPEERDIVVDTTAPSTTIDSGPSGPTNDATPTFAFSSDEASSSYECSLDGGPWSPCSSPETTASLDDGPHTFEVRAIDAAGNVDPTPASQAFAVDTGGPATTIDSGPSGATNEPAPTYTFTSDEPGSTFECRVDAGAWIACSSPFAAGPLADGPHTFEVRATDLTGNQGPPAERQIVVDTAAPDTTIDSGPSGPTSDPTPTFTFNASEPGSYECRVDGGAWAACDSPETAAPLTDGPHTFEVRAIDAAGNVDPTPAQRAFTVSTAAPPEEPEPAGSLLGATTCQQLAPGPRSMKRRVPGVGRVTVKMAAEGTIVGTSPLMVTTRAPRARTRSVRYFLDNRRLRGTNRRLGWAQAITPASLANSSTHTLTIAVAGRGGRKRFALRFSTLRCDAVFTASQKNKGRYSELALRVDTRTPARSIVYTVPRRLVPRARPNTVAGSLMVQTSAGVAQIYPLRFSSGGVLAGAASGARVAIAGGQLSVSDLPAGTKIATLTLKRNRTKSARASRKPIRLRASLTADVSYLLTTRLRGKR